MPRRKDRAVFDREAVYAILDEALVCHVGFEHAGQVFVIPTAYGRKEDRLIIHGAAMTRMMQNLSGGLSISVTVTILDGLVLARSAFHHSINYRSVVILGTASVVSDEAEKLEALRVFTEHVIPGRWAEVRGPTEKELKLTTVLELPINEVSAKVRTGPPVDDREDYGLDVWAGELPLRQTPGIPVPDPALRPGIEVPEHVRQYGNRL
ncbi:MAG: pyridoxamine 5'-phosphate oxidase family protein [Spirochaetales bacterium]|nr:pyridoxamine 5'-phosphate oxidase family protein [Spirochaetales bacterium]MCP5485794.1 pyridoxamine 5'-phosphate oxidase family protein [Spirochaetales bacterium]